MPKILKPFSIVGSDEVVQIPDIQRRAQPSQAGQAPEDASQVYETMVDRAKDEASRISDGIVKLAHDERDRILAEARQEAERLRAEAQQQGYMEGLQQKAGEIDGCMQGLLAQMEALRQEHRQFMERYAAELKVFALEIASKVVNQKLAEEQTLLAPLVQNVLSTIRDADWISVEVSQQLPQLVKKLEADLAAKDSGGTRVEVAPRDVEPGSVLIQTSDGVVDASLSTQLENLMEYFNQMAD